MNHDFERYHCQMALPQFGEKGQKLLKQMSILIIGAGGLGCPAAQYLTATGIGTLAIADDDVISTRNLHRQILFNPEDIGLKKVTVACKRLRLQNPSVKIIPYDLYVTSENVMDLISSYDLIIEGTDNFETKCLVNDACVLAGKPLIYGAIYQYEGQVAVWNVMQEDGTYSPHYRDVFPEAEKSFTPDCSEGGVMPPLTGIVGCMQANEAIKYIVKDKNLLAGKLWIFNAQTSETKIIHLSKSSHTEIAGLPETIQTISYDELAKGLQHHAYELIDVRSSSEHQVYNIGGKNIPSADMEAWAEENLLSKPVVFYCAAGKRSAAAVRKMKEKFPKAEFYSLRGGVDGVMREQPPILPHLQ
ncbi:MAG: ThiF family adenylyltransferase, partial [Chitinophagaceae bacterium]